MTQPGSEPRRRGPRLILFEDEAAQWKLLLELFADEGLTSLCPRHRPRFRRRSNATRARKWSPTGGRRVVRNPR